MAASCNLWPIANAGDAGVTVIDESEAAVVVSVTLPEISPEVAISVAVPRPNAVAVPPLVTESTAGLLDTQFKTAGVAVLLSENIPVAANVIEAPIGSGGRLTGVTAIPVGGGARAAGVTAMLCRAGGPMLSEALPETEPMEALICTVA